MHRFSSQLRLLRIGLFFCLVVGVLLMMQVSVCAHPPTNVSMTYDKVSGVLTVTVNHTSDDLTLHYIERIDITVNEEFQEIVPYEWDESDNDLVATYNITLNDGDKVVAEAQCFVEGSYLGYFVVGDTGDDASTPGFEMLIFLGAVMFFFVIRKLRISNT